MGVVDKNAVLNYLIKNKRAYSSNELADVFKVDSFFINQILEELFLNYSIKLENGKYSVANYKKYQLLKDYKMDKYYVLDGDYKKYISNKRLNGAVENDIVLVDPESKKNNVEVLDIVEKYKKNSVGTVVSVDGKFMIKPDKEKCYIQTSKDLILGQKVIYTKGKLVKDNVYAGNVIKSIGHIDDPKIDINSALAAYNFDLEFSKEAKKQLESIPQEIDPSDIPNRVDLRNETIFTIDGDDTKDIDDAVSLEKLSNGNYLLGVHIADVSYYVPEGSALDKDAYKRGTSVYPPGCVNPMLPHELSSGICSLFEGKDRYTMSCEMEISPNGELIKYDIFPSVINSSKRMTYKNVNKVLEGNSPEDYKKFSYDLNLMNELKDKLRKNRMNNGSIEFDSDELKFSLDENGKPLDIYYRNHGEGENLIEEFMLVANTTVAGFLSDNEMPALYRIHDEPDEAKLTQSVDIIANFGVHVKNKNLSTPVLINKIINKLKTNPNSKVLNNLLLRSMKKAEYSNINHGHFGLGFKEYCHFTSPIRRYPDLTIHRCIRAALAEKQLDKAYVNQMNSYLSEAGIHCSIKERDAAECERTVNRMKEAEYLQKDVGKDFDGKLYSIGKDGLKIQLYNGILGTIPYSTIPGIKYDCRTMHANQGSRLYNLGDNLRVKLIEANKEKGQILFVDDGLSYAPQKVLSRR